MKNLAAFVGFILAAGVSAAAAQTGALAEGRGIAEGSCAGCHQIYVDRATVGSNNSGPGFADVARMPSTTELALKVFLQTTHGGMPNLVLTKDERESVVAYILSLAGKQMGAPPQGRRIAEDSCASCHQIYADRPTVGSNNSGPGFADVARMPSTTELALKVFLQTTHGGMPNLILTKDERDAVAAYILSLAPRPK